jgi:phenylalanyl-tRNA synthetase beta chain
MIVSYNWLKEFVDVSLPPQELSDLLTMLGLEVEGMECRFDGMDQVVVAVVEEKAKHPNADKLSLCRVSDGTESITIVCGAQNFSAGDKVALAKVGAVLPGNFTIKRSKIRGEESCGMLCSEKELGLAEESSGIMILPGELSLGTPLFQALGLKDTILEIGLTPNRADCLSVIGIAREIAAKLALKVRYPRFGITEGTSPIHALASVRIEDPDLCPRYTARYISGCRIAPSPQWLVNRLKAVGMRSINNVVDVTNYVLLEFGHPLHAFDFDRLAGGKIIVRRAGEGECFKTLDGQERTLKSSDLAICDSTRIVALAGIMGGENSEISDDTTNILLESAYFSPSAIRLTSKRLGLHTESSHRFERGADIEALTKALDRAASLIAELSGGTIAEGFIDEFPRSIPQKRIQLRVNKVNQLLGLNLSPETMQVLLENLEFNVEKSEHGIFEVMIPSFRVDIEREIDLIEEIARLHGYEHIPVTMPKARVFSDLLPRSQRLEKTLRNLLFAHGYNEVINFSFISPESWDKILLAGDDPRRNAVKVLNPLVEEQSVMRTTLLPSMLESAAKNFSFRLINQRIFELRRVYRPRAGQELPHEPLYLGVLVSGRRCPEGWDQEKAPVDFYDVKGDVENICRELRMPHVSFTAASIENFYHPGKACTIFMGNDAVGSMGEIHPEVQQNYGIEQPLFYFELDFEKLVAHSSQTVDIRPPSRFPDTYRDIAMLIADDVTAATVIESVHELAIGEVADVTIFDLYKGDNIPAGQKSLAIRVRYRSPERTLTDEEVNIVHQRVIGHLTGKLNATIR